MSRRYQYHGSVPFIRFNFFYTRGLIRTGPGPYKAPGWHKKVMDRDQEIFISGLD